MVAHRDRRGHRVGGVGHRRAGLESAWRLARLVHVPLDAGAAAGHAAGAALGRHHRHRAGGRELVGARDLGRRAGRPGAGRATGRRAPRRASPIRSPYRCSSASARRSGASPARDGLGDVRALARRRPSDRRAIPPTWRSGPAAARWSTSWPSTRSTSHPRCFRPWCGTWRRETRSGSPRPLRVPGVHYVLLVRCAPARSHDHGNRSRARRLVRARSRGPAARPREPAAAALPAHARRLRPIPPRRRRAPAGAARAGRSGTSIRSSSRAGAGRCMPRSISVARCRCSSAACWSFCSMRRCSALLWFAAELVGGARCAAALAEPRSLVPDPARRHLRRLLSAADDRLRGVELRATRRRGPAEPRPAHHPDAAGRGAHGRRLVPGRQPDARRAATRAQPAYRRGPRAVPGRPPRRNQHAGARGSRA